MLRVHRFQIIHQSRTKQMNREADDVNLSVLLLIDRAYKYDHLENSKSSEEIDAKYHVEDSYSKIRKVPEKNCRGCIR